MKKATKHLTSTSFTAVLFILSVVAAILFRSCRSNWIFIGLTLGFETFSAIMLVLMSVVSAVLGALLAIKLYKNTLCNKKAYSIIYFIALALATLLIIFSSAYTIGCSIGEGSQVFSLTLKKTLTEGAPLLLVGFFTLLYPAFSCKVKKIVALISLIAVIIFGINGFHPLTSYKITSEPLVIDNGEEYSIVFSTNDKGTAYAEYTYNGKEYKIYDNIGGRLDGDSKIHSIAVPYEHLRNNTYKVGSTRVIEEFSYGSRRGKTVTSAEYKFTYNDSENQTWLVVSDWHTLLDMAYMAIDKIESDYDAVILLGDSSPGVDFEEQIITNIVQFGGKVSGGTKPVLYVRGNHETRGAFADELPVALGLDQLYYTADFGDYSFVVLDSGEDKDDSHPEYGGMNDYNTYRSDMIEWLKNVRLSDEKVIALSHAWQISSVEDYLSKDGWAELDRLGTRLILSGHEHCCRFLGSRDGKETEYVDEYPNIVGYIDGGKIGSETYVASLLTLNKEEFKIKAVDANGNEIMNETFKW